MTPENSETKSHYSKDGKKPYRPRENRGYGNDHGHRRNDDRPRQNRYGDKGGRNNDRPYRRNDDRQGKPYQKREYGNGDKGPGDRKPYGDKGHYNGDRPHNHDNRSGDYRDHRPRDDRRHDGTYQKRDDRQGKPYQKREYGDGDRKPYGDRDKRPYNGNDRKPYQKREYGDGERKPYPKKHFDGERGDDRRYRQNDRRDGYRRDSDKGDRRKGSERNDRSYQRRDDRRHNDEGDRREERNTEVNLTVPSTPQKILFKGIDCEINGRSDLAMYLYLHGAVMMSGGCENNMTRMLREMGSGEFSSARGRVAKSCPPECLLAFDYLCATVDESYDIGSLRAASEEGDLLATYCLIRLGEVEGDDPRIDLFASKVAENEAMVEDGLKILSRKKDSEKAEEHIRKLGERKNQRQLIRPAFVKALKGDVPATQRLEDLGKSFPEAQFLRGYIDSDDREDYIRNGMPEFRDIIMSVAKELDIAGTPYGLYLVAKKLQIDGDEWIPSMISAVAAGSEDAMEDLRPVQNRRDVRKSLANIYLTRGDAAGLVRCYDGEDTFMLEKYCAGDAQKCIEVGALMGGMRELDWLKKCYRDGMEDCRSAIIAMSSDEERRGKQLVYALHDVGADMEAAKLYMDMYGNPALPALKWLGKVCENEEAKEYLRTRFEEIGETLAFESIFVDDGYERRDRRGGRRR